MLGAVASGMGHANENIPVVDASPGISRQANVSQPNISVAQGGTSAGSQAAELLYQLELLQQEVQELRGIVEQQEYQMNRMRESQRDRYLDLDRRITLLNQASSKPTPVESTKPVSSQPTTQTSVQPSTAPVTQTKPATATAAPASTTPGVDKAGEKKAYQAAFALVRNKQYAKAGSAFEQLIKDYPDGNYTGNAYYWLGEVLLVESDYEQALKAFGSLLGNFPGHRKAADAKYKQGKIYLQLGENARAKQLLQGVVDQHAGTSAAKLAEAEMRDAQL